MKLKLPLLAGLALAGHVSLALAASSALQPATQSEAAKAVPLGAEKSLVEFTNIEVRNFQDEPLGRITDLGIDLINGRIVQALIITDSSLEGEKKVVAVPPMALVPDLLNRVYRLNMSSEAFNAAPAIDLENWNDAGRSRRVAASYRLFGHEPYFLEVGETASTTAQRPEVPLGYVERCNKIVDLPVQNLQGDKFGKVWSMTLDIPKGRILNVIILAPGNFKTKTIVPAMALSFNAERDGLLLDSTKQEYADEPRYVFTEASFGNDATAEEQAYKGKRTSLPLEQGSSYRDIDRTVQINRDIRGAKIKSRHVNVGTKDGRVTLRGWVESEGDKSRINAIAIAASRLELVDNQLTVGKPSS